MEMMEHNELRMFLAIIVQMGHGIHDRLGEYWTRTEQFFTPFYLNTMTQDLSGTSYVTCISHKMTKKLRGRTTITIHCGILREVYDILNVAY
jgi:hypothetical protein